MSILIKGMDMPKNCGECPFYYYEYKECNAIGGRMVFRNATPPTDCPLIELPPHGRLIDADALTQQIMMKADAMCGWADALDLALAPTIIEAEETNK